MKLTRESLARMCGNAGINPVHREAYRDYTILVGDGRVTNPGVVLQRFGVEEDQFPFGCFCTVWCIAKDEDIWLAGVLPNRLDHDPEHDANSKRMARVASGVGIAREHIDKARRISAEGVPLNA